MLRMRDSRNALAWQWPRNCGKFRQGLLHPSYSKNSALCLIRLFANLIQSCIQHIQFTDHHTKQHIEEHRDDNHHIYSVPPIEDHEKEVFYNVDSSLQLLNSMNDLTCLCISFVLKFKLAHLLQRKIQRFSTNFEQKHQEADQKCLPEDLASFGVEFGADDNAKECRKLAFPLPMAQENLIKDKWIKR